jgi:hypothetical protein
MNQDEIIVCATIEAGMWELTGRKNPAGTWCFRTVRDETAWLEFNDADRADFEPWQESDWVGSWEAALELFNRYPWHLFHALKVHPRFQREVWQAVQARFTTDGWPRTLHAHHSFHSWHRLCHAGGPAAV